MTTAFEWIWEMVEAAREPITSGDIAPILVTRQSLQELHPDLSDEQARQVLRVLRNRFRLADGLHVADIDEAIAIHRGDIPDNLTLTDPELADVALSERLVAKTLLAHTLKPRADSFEADTSFACACDRWPADNLDSATATGFALHQAAEVIKALR